MMGNDQSSLPGFAAALFGRAEPALRRIGRRAAHGLLSPLCSGLFSLLLIGAIIAELSQVDVDRSWTGVPASATFWFAFALYFWGSPFVEWLILHRLWQAPFSGFWAVLRKMVYNEMVLSYLGDAYFFAWMKRALPHVASPFAVVKDMAIVSAFMGSAMTMLAIAIVWPFFSSVDRTGLQSSVLLCLALALASGGGIAIFRKALLSLSRREIAWIGGLFGLRILGQSACAVAMWWSLLPQVPLTTWIVLSAVRMVSARLPLVPSKDLAFAAATVALVGPHTDVAPMIVLVTGLILLANIVLALALSLASGGQWIARRRTVAV